MKKLIFVCYLISFISYSQTFDLNKLFYYQSLSLNELEDILLVQGWDYSRTSNSITYTNTRFEFENRYGTKLTLIHTTRGGRISKYMKNEQMSEAQIIIECEDKYYFTSILQELMSNGYSSEKGDGPLDPIEGLTKYGDEIAISGRSIEKIYRKGNKTVLLQDYEYGTFIRWDGDNSYIYDKANLKTIYSIVINPLY